MLLAGFEDGHGKSVLRRFPFTSSREMTRDLTLGPGLAAARANRATSLSASQATPQMTSFRETTRDLTLDWGLAAARANRATSLSASQATPQITSFRERASGGFGKRRRLFEQAAEGRRFQQVSSVHLPVFDLQFRENRRRLRRPVGRALAPETAQPGAQLPVARLALEDPLDHELGCDGAVPVLFLEP